MQTIMLKTFAYVASDLNMDSHSQPIKYTIHDAMLVVGDDAIELGCIERGESRRVEIESTDSVRVVFRLGDEWIGTDMLPMRDTIRIDDNTETFEVR